MFNKHLFFLLFFFSSGSVMSLVAGLLFGTISAYGAFRVSSEPSDVTVSLRKSILIYSV